MWESRAYKPTLSPNMQSDVIRILFMSYHVSGVDGTAFGSDAHTTELATAKLHPTIPLEQKEQLCERRCFESENIMYKFQELFTATKKSL